MKSDEYSFEGINIFSDGALEDLSITFTLNGYLDSINSIKITEYFHMHITPNRGTKILNVIFLLGFTAFFKIRD